MKRSGLMMIFAATVLSGCTLNHAGQARMEALPHSPNAPQPASRQIASGFAIVQKRCANCHAVGLQGASPRADAPPLRDLYKRYPVDGLRTAFKSGVHVCHLDMPTFTLPNDEVDAVIAYLGSIDPCKQPSSDRLAMKRCFAPL